MENKQHEIMTMNQICDYLQVNREIVLGFIDEGMPSFNLTQSPTSHKRFLKKDVDNWLSRRSKGGEGNDGD